MSASRNATHPCVTARMEIVCAGPAQKLPKRTQNKHGTPYFPYFTFVLGKRQFYNNPITRQSLESIATHAHTSCHIKCTEEKQRTGPTSRAHNTDQHATSDYSALPPSPLCKIMSTPPPNRKTAHEYDTAAVRHIFATRDMLNHQ